MSFLEKKTIFSAFTPFPIMSNSADFNVFNSTGVTGFLSIFQIYSGDSESQLRLVKELAQREPYSESGAAASRWLLLREAR